jgi:prepilin-type processing-associated H-X9-DG protein
MQEARVQQGPYDAQPLTPRRNTGWIIALSIGGGCLVITLAIVAVVAAILFPVFAQARAAARRASCMSNVKQMSAAALMYAQDYDGYLPPVAAWENNLQPYLRSVQVYRCPERTGVVHGYAYNQLLDRRPIAEVQNGAQTPLFFESSLGSVDAADRLESFVTPHRDSSGQPAGIVAFADGHVQALGTAPKAAAGLAPTKPVAKPPSKGRR